MNHNRKLVRTILLALAGHSGVDFLDLTIPGVRDSVLSAHIKRMAHTGLIGAVSSRDGRTWRATHVTWLGRVLLYAPRHDLYTN